MGTGHTIFVVHRSPRASIWGTRAIVLLLLITGWGQQEPTLCSTADGMVGLARRRGHFLGVGAVICVRRETDSSLGDKQDKAMGPPLQSGPCLLSHFLPRGRGRTGCGPDPSALMGVCPTPFCLACWSCWGSALGELCDLPVAMEQGRGLWEDTRETPLPDCSSPPWSQMPHSLPSQAESQVALPSLWGPGRPHTCA